jgi:predicted dehydrogenase
MVTPVITFYETLNKAMTMTTKVAIIGLGIMGQRMLTHMRRHQNFEPDYLWDPDQSACQQAIISDPQSHVMDSAIDAINKAELVYLACPPAVRGPVDFLALLLLALNCALLTMGSHTLYGLA